MEFTTDIKVHLVAQGIAAAKIIVSPTYKIPATGDFISLTETGGVAPYYTHNEAPAPALAQPSMQLRARSSTHAGAMALARAAYNALNVNDVTINGTKYLWIRPAQEPHPLPPDENDRAQVVFNINSLRKPF